MSPNLEVVPLRGENLRFWVASRSKPDWHLVDLSFRAGQGMCDCEMFKFCALKNSHRHGRFVPYEYDPETWRCGNSHEASECAHIRAAREWMHERFVRPLYSMQANGEAEWFQRLVAGVSSAERAEGSQDHQF